jgi:hypothetical protein
MFFGFTLRALTKRSSQQQFYLDTRDLKSTRFVTFKVQETALCRPER